MTTAHRIRRLRWRVRAGTQAEAFAVRLRLRQMHDETGLLSELERAFDATGVGSEVVHIPRLALTLRVPDLDQIGPALVAGVYREIEEWRASRSAAVEASARGDGSPRAESVPVNGVDALVSYLETGMLPWPLANAGREQIFARLADASSRDPDLILAHVPASLERAVPFLFRWLQLVPEAEWIDIARRAERGSPAGALSGLEAAIRSLSAPDMPMVAGLGRERLLHALRVLERRGDPADAEAVRIVSRILSSFAGEQTRHEPHGSIGRAELSSGETRGVESERENVPTLQWMHIELTAFAVDAQGDHEACPERGPPGPSRRAEAGGFAAQFIRTSGVAGILRMSYPAWRSALTTAGAGPSIGISPTPFAPNGPCLYGRSRMNDSMGGVSGGVGMM